MDPTVLPTDNLYKFIALSGLALAGFCAWFWWKVKQKIWEAEGPLEEERDRIKWAGQGMRPRLEAIQTTQRELELPPANADERNALQKKLEAMMRELKALLDKSEDLILEGEPRRNAFARLQRVATRLSRLLLAGAVLGGIISVAGFSTWYVKLQKPLDAKLKLELEVQTLELQARKLDLQEKKKPDDRSRVSGNASTLAVPSLATASTRSSSGVASVGPAPVSPPGAPAPVPGRLIAPSTHTAGGQAKEVH